MRPLDYLEPLPLRDAADPLRRSLAALSAGTPVAYPVDDGWRLVCPVDALSLPPNRQLCDVPNRPLPLLDLNAEVELSTLVQNEVWGTLANQQLVGRVDRGRILGTLAEAADVELEAAAAVDARDRLMPKLLHDLANALHVVSLAHGEPRSAQGAGPEAIRHAMAMVHHMRTLYAASGSEAESPLAIREVLEDIAPMLVVAAKPARLTVTPRCEGRLRGRRWRLESALLNLVLNAGAKATHIAVTLDDAGPHTLELSVEDDGPGFPPPAEHAGTDPLRGHGLRSIRRQVAAMGGSLAVSVAELGGARVTLRLPRASR